MDSSTTVEIMIIYNSTWSILIHWIRDQVYTIESVLPDCDKPYHMNNGFQQMWAEIKKLRNCPLPIYNKTLSVSIHFQVIDP